MYSGLTILQLKLQQRRSRQELINQGIMPPAQKGSSAFHEHRRSLERARTEDYLKTKFRCRPERSELIRMHILEQTRAEPRLQATQLQLKRARLADNLNDKLSHRPGPMELIHKNILPVHSSIKRAIIGEYPLTPVPPTPPPPPTPPEEEEEEEEQNITIITTTTTQQQQA
ncbi:hypothetical protein CRUP_025365 [Coryphaenoides rupestris]|nr:hypothetical protein CRUP_025365 [Coryphaenoides rupestris]